MTYRIKLSTSILALGLLPAGRLTATTIIYDDFSSVAGLKLNGNAAQAGNVLRLVPAVVNQSGSAFSTSTISLGGNVSFSTYFQFRITASGGISDPDGIGADGLVFAIQTVSNTAGGSGGGLGFQGLSPSLGIEFDTFFNSAWDPNGNHVGVDLNGNITSAATQTEPTRFNNDAVWNAWVDYDGSANALEVRWSLSTTRPTASQLSQTVNLAALLGSSNVFAGFTAGTGSGYGNHDILRWEFRDTFSPVIVTPEPRYGIVIGAMLGGLALIRRRRLTRSA